MSKKLYVGNLPYSFTDGDLQGLFAGQGNVTSSKVIIDRATGRSKGFGFVEMSSADEASRAAQAMNGADCMGRSLKVDIARENPAGGQGGGGGFGGGRPGGQRRSYGGGGY